jgi:phospholipid N-methyltransferase
MSSPAPDFPAKANPRLPLPEAPRPDWLLMLTKFLQQGKAIASFAPSSPYLSRAILRGIDFDAAKCIVELGAGTGPVTAELLRRVRPQTTCIIIERDPDFCRRLRERFPKADIVEGDAAHYDRLLTDRGFTHADHIISGLPLPSFPNDLRNAILAKVADTLAPGGSFRQLTVMPYVYRRLYKSYFDEVRFKPVPLNLPPGGVYVCRGYRERAKG